MGLVLAMLACPSVAFAQPRAAFEEVPADDGGWGAEVPADAGPATEAPPPPPAPPPALVLTPPPAPPKVVLPPGAQMDVRAKCGRQMSEPVRFECPACGPVPGAPPPEPRRIWYGWETLLMDLGMMGVVYVAASNDHSPPWGLYLVGATLGTPIIHFANGKPTSGVASLAIRGGALALFLSSARHDNGDFDDDSVEIASALFLFLVHIPMTAVDAAVFARKPAPPLPPQTALAPRIEGLSPLLASSVGAHTPDTFGAALSGTF